MFVRAVFTIGLLLCLVAVPATQAEPGPVGSQFRISQMGTDGDASFDADYPALAYSATAGKALVVWTGDDITDGDEEIYGRLIDSSGSPLGGQFRISNMGSSANYDAANPAVAYNSSSNEFFVVWYGDDNSGALVDGEDEIYGQRVDINGTLQGSRVRLSDIGTDGDSARDARDPMIAYNATAGEYLVVFSADDSVDNELEIYGQRVSSAGAETGTNDFRISDMGPNGNTSFNAYHPDVVLNTTSNRYLVAWQGDDNTAPLVDNEYEVFGQLLDASGSEVGTNDFRISDMGTDGDTNYGMDFLNSRVALAYNSKLDEYLTVWMSDDNTGSLVNDEFEIFGQRLSSAGAETGTNDFRISDMGPDGNTGYLATWPALSYNAPADEYLVVWTGTDNTAPLVAGEYEIFGQRLTSAGAETGTSDMRISQMGTDGSTLYNSSSPAVAYDAQANRYLSAWSADHNSGTLVDNELEVWGRGVEAGVVPTTTTTTETTTESTSGSGAGAAADTTGPVLTLKRLGSNISLRKRRSGAKVVVQAKCDEACTVSYTGKLSTTRKVKGLGKIKKANASLAANELKTFVVSLSKKQTKALRRALTPKKKKKKRPKAYLKLRFTATDTVGNKTLKDLKFSVIK